MHIHAMGAAVLMVAGAWAGSSGALLSDPTADVESNSIAGHYVEARTCQVYTGPCFANGESGLAGKDAVMAWTVTEGARDGVDLTGLSVAVVVHTSNTLGFRGFEDATEIKTMIVVDELADGLQHAALVAFARQQTGKAGENVSLVRTAAINMELDVEELTADVQVGSMVKLQTRQARKGDCICSNESAYYPPLAKLEGFVPGVTIEGEVKALRLGSSWSIPDTRTAYMGTFLVR